MDCNRISELLPWLMNGTLPEPEKTLVNEHLTGCAKCGQAFDETKMLLKSAQTHVPIEVLLDYADGRKLKNFDPVQFEKHLALCGECSEQLKLVSESFGAIEIEEATSNVVSLTAEKEKRRTVFAPNRFWKYAAIAACLLLTATFIAWLYNYQQLKKSQSEHIAQEKSLQERINTLETESKQNSERLSQEQTKREREIEELKNKLAEKEREAQNQTSQTKTQSGNQQPQANVIALDVFPSSVSRSESANENSLIIPRDAQAVTLILNSQSPATSSRYAVELLNSSGQVIWSNKNMRRYSNNDFTVSLPAQMLRVGNYVIQIFAIDNGRKEKIETYRIRLTKN